MSKSLPRQCKKFRKWLPDYVEGVLPQLLCRPLEHHLAACKLCATEAEDLRAVLGAVREVVSEEPSKNLVPRIRRAVHQHTPAPVTMSRFWTRLAVPVAVLTGVIAISFALRQPATQPSFISGNGASQQQQELAQAPASESTPTLERMQKPAPEAVGAESKGADTVTIAPRIVEIKPIAPTNETQPVGSERPSPARVKLRQDMDGQTAYDSSAPARGGGGMGGGGARGSATQPSPDKEQLMAGQTPGTLGLTQPSAPTEAKRRTEKSDALAALTEQAAQPPFYATAVLAKGGQGEIIALRVSADRPLENFVLTLGDQPPQSLQWQGEPAKPIWIPLSKVTLGPGPATIPITLTSEVGARNYVLFIPTLSRLGEKVKIAPAARYEGVPLRAVLADYSALTGLVILAERPTDTKITGELSAIAPGVALQRLAADNNLVVQQEGELAFTLTHPK